MDDLLKICNGKNLTISSEVDMHLADADIILICVKTPAKSLGVGRVNLLFIDICIICLIFVPIEFLKVG